MELATYKAACLLAYIIFLEAARLCLHKRDYKHPGKEIVVRRLIYYSSG